MKFYCPTLPSHQDIRYLKILLTPPPPYEFSQLQILVLMKNAIAVSRITQTITTDEGIKD